MQPWHYFSRLVGTHYHILIPDIMKRFLSYSLLALSFLQSFATVEKKQLKIRIIEQATSLLDETSVYLDDGISSTYIFPEDAPKQFSSNPLWPQIYSFTSDSVACYSNGFGNFVSTTVIALGVRVNGGSVYSFTATTIDKFDPTSIIRLEDRVLGIFHDLRGGSYSVQLSQTQFINDRFFIHVSYPAVVTTTDADCNNTNGSINIVQDNSVSWTNCSLYDSTSNLLGTYANINGAFNFNGLVDGNYYLVFTYHNYVVTKVIHVTGRQVISQVVVSNLTPVVGEVVTFNTVSSNATSFNWDFGDGSVTTGVANTETTYGLPGTYRVVVNMWNSYGCSDSTVLTIVVGAATSVTAVADSKPNFYYSSQHIFIQHTAQCFFRLIDLSGRVVLEKPLVESTHSFAVSDDLKGIFIAEIADANSSFRKKLLLY